MRQIQIRARANRDIECLQRELAAYSPKPLRQRTILIELHGRSNKDLLKLLSAIETCVGENDIRSVRLDLDGETYTLAAQERPRPPARRGSGNRHASPNREVAERSS